MADPNTTNVRPPDEIDHDKYDSGGSKGKRVVLPPKGRHRFQTIAVVCDPTTRTQEGYLKATITVKVIAPSLPHDAHEIRFVSLSTKRYSNREANQMLDYLRACGIDARPKTDDEYVRLVQSTLNGQFEAGVNWEAYDKEAQETLVKDMDDFPIGDNGERQQFVVRKNDPKQAKIWARARLTYYVDRVGTAAN